MTNIITILPKIYFSARWLVKAIIQNRDTCVPTEVESDLGFSSKIGTILPKSGCLDTLQGMFGGKGGSGGMLPQKKFKI